MASPDVIGAEDPLMAFSEALLKGAMRRYCLFECSRLSALRNHNKP